MRAALAAAVAAAALACAAGSGRSGPSARDASEGAARETLARFARAVAGGRWADAHGLLSERWRSGYTPERLAADAEGAGPVGREAAERALAALAAGAPLAGSGARRTVEVGAGRAAVLVLEAPGWRVDALE